jgi:hypothetical protein
MSQPIRRWKECESCGQQFEFARSTRRYCSDRCQKRTERGVPPGFSAAVRTVLSRPRTLSDAVKLIEAGVPLRHLILEADAQAALVAACKLFDGEQRLKAAARLADRLGQMNSSHTPWATKVDAGWVNERHDHGAARYAGASEVRVPSDIELGIIDVLEKAFELCDSFPSPHSNQRKKVHWTPADWSWSLLLNAYLVWAVRKQHVRPREDDPLSYAYRLEQSIGEGDQRLEDVVGAEDDDEAKVVPILPREVRKLKGFALADPNTGLAYPFGGRGGSEQSARTFHKRKFDQRHKEAMEMTLGEANAVADRLEAVQQKADELFERVSATLEEVKWRFPTDADVTEAVDQLIEDLSA